jgi:ActR/RegA family two-component response regulator
MKALLIEHSEPTYTVLEQSLTHMDFEVSHAQNSLEAYKIMADEKFDVLIADLKICEENHGRLFDTICQIKEYSDICILPLIEDNESNKKKLTKLGTDTFIVKPICMNTFRGVLTDYKQKREENFTYDNVISFEIKEEKYENLRKLLSNYIDMNDDKFNYVKSKLALKYYSKGDTIYYPDGICDSFIYINDGVSKGIQNKTNKIWYLYFNNPNLESSDDSHTVIQDYFSFIYNEESNIRFEAICDCEVLYIKYSDLEDIFIKYDSFDSFRYMLSDLEMKRIDKQIEEHLDNDNENILNSFIKNKSYLLSMIEYQPISEYLKMEMEEIYTFRKEIIKKDMKGL